MGLAQPTRFGEVAPGPFKVVLNNAELAALGVRAASAAPLAGLVIVAPGPAGAAASVSRVPPGEALALVRPQLRSSWDLLPFPAGVTAERRFGSTDAGLASVLERVPVLRARWRPGSDDPADVIAAVRDQLT